MTEKGEPMLLMGLFTAEVMGGREVMAAAEGVNGGERWPDGGEETDELSGLWESVRTEVNIISLFRVANDFKRCWAFVKYLKGENYVFYMHAKFKKLILKPSYLYL